MSLTVDTVGKFPPGSTAVANLPPPLSLTPAINLPPVSTAPVVNLLPVSLIRLRTLNCEYLNEFSEKFEMALMENNTHGPGGRLFNAKTLGQK